MMESRDEVLDVVRGASAFAVLAGHARNFILVDYSHLSHPTPVAKLFYLLSSIHHEAVMVFFVLSGYFVGGSVLGALRKGRFTWGGYAAARLSRLWVVLLPALLLTLALDTLGRSLDPAAYSGSLEHVFNSGPSTIYPYDGSVAAFFGNLVFLQNIAVPAYGTNGPLWSLAAEFWYYAIFPLLACALAGMRSSWLRSAGLLLIALAICYFIPRGILLYGIIWIMGVGVWLLSRQPRVMAVVNTWPWRIITGGLFIGSIPFAKLQHAYWCDYLIGLLFSLWVISLLGKWNAPRWCRKSSEFFSEISFTLYVTHFPLLFLIVVLWTKGVSLPFDLPALLLLGGLMVFSIAVAALLWWMFESRTRVVRNWLRKFGV